MGKRNYDKRRYRRKSQKIRGQKQMKINPLKESGGKKE
jgi:hypothetical protein